MNHKSVEERLYWAVRLSDFYAAKAALKAGASVKYRRFDGTSLVEHASLNGDYELILLLVRHGANEEDIIWDAFTARDIVKWMDMKKKSLGTF